MLDTITVQSLVIGTGTNYSILNAKGFESPIVDLAKYNLGGRHGINITRALWRERRLRLEIGLRAATETAYGVLRRNLLKAFDLPRVGATATITFTTTDGLNLQFDAQLLNAIDGGFESGELTVGKMRFELIVPSSVIVGQNEQTTDVYLPVAGGTTLPAELPLAFAVSGGAGNADNGGNGIYLPTIRIVGPVTNPHVRNSTLDLQLTISRALVSTDYVDIDCDAETVILNGVTSILDEFSGDFWWLKAGDNSLQYNADTYSADSYARITHRDAYVGV